MRISCGIHRNLTLTKWTYLGSRCRLFLRCGKSGSCFIQSFHNDKDDQCHEQEIDHCCYKFSIIQSSITGKFPRLINSLNSSKNFFIFHFPLDIANYTRFSFFRQCYILKLPCNPCTAAIYFQESAPDFRFFLSGQRYSKDICLSIKYIFILHCTAML